ncbi:MAG: hypothetical protein ACOYK8_06480 [Alphaproteobacteria bacterium]
MRQQGIRALSYLLIFYGFFSQSITRADVPYGEWKLLTYGEKKNKQCYLIWSAHDHIQANQEKSALISQLSFSMKNQLFSMPEFMIDGLPFLEKGQKLNVKIGKRFFDFTVMSRQGWINDDPEQQKQFTEMLLHYDKQDNNKVPLELKLETEDQPEQLMNININGVAKGYKAMVESCQSAWNPIQ